MPLRKRTRIINTTNRFLAGGKNLRAGKRPKGKRGPVTIQDIDALLKRMYSYRKNTLRLYRRKMDSKKDRMAGKRGLITRVRGFKAGSAGDLAFERAISLLDEERRLRNMRKEILGEK